MVQVEPDELLPNFFMVDLITQSAGEPPILTIYTAVLETHVSGRLPTNRSVPIPPSSNRGIST